MRLDNREMPPFNTTLMGVIQGALRYYGIEVSDATVFGVSGHAFLINIHEQLCPSGPYCWRREPMEPLLRNLGLEMRDLGFYSPSSTPDERAKVEAVLRETLDRGIPCSLLNMENQLIGGYDERGFFTAQPWARNSEFPPARLTFGTWQEFGERYHVTFYALERGTPAERRKAVLDSLDYAVDVHMNPTRHSREGYGVGPEAYANWIRATPEHGGSHGNWWNATVWSECRRMASAWFTEIGRAYRAVTDAASDLAHAYRHIADALERVSDRTMDPGVKITLLEETKVMEAGVITGVAHLAASLRAVAPASA